MGSEMCIRDRQVAWAKLSTGEAVELLAIWDVEVALSEDGFPEGEILDGVFVHVDARSKIPVRMSARVSGFAKSPTSDARARMRRDRRMQVVTDVTVALV